MSEQALKKSDIEPSAELPPDLALDANELEAVPLVKREACFLSVDHSSEHGVEAVGGRTLDQGSEKGIANALSVVVAMDIDRVLDGGPIAGAIPIEAEGAKPDDLTFVGITTETIVDRGHHRQHTGTSADVVALFFGCSFDEVEGVCAVNDLTVVDPGDRSGVSDVGVSNQHSVKGNRRYPDR